jgi:hypothetical protein
MPCAMRHRSFIGFRNRRSLHLGMKRTGIYTGGRAPLHGESPLTSSSLIQNPAAKSTARAGTAPQVSEWGRSNGRRRSSGLPLERTRCYAPWRCRRATTGLGILRGKTDDATIAMKPQPDPSTRKCWRDSSSASRTTMRRTVSAFCGSGHAATATALDLELTEGSVIADSVGERPVCFWQVCIGRSASSPTG